MTNSNLPLSLVVKLVLLALPFSQVLWAQEPSANNDSEATATFEVATEADEEEYEFSQAELDQLLAPVALYPDTILSHVLVASTYPLEVVQAARWSKNNNRPQGNIALEAAESKDWAPSVKALVQFPDLIQKMSEDLDWMQQLGDAFLQNEEMVLATVQNLRQQAHSEGSLDDIKHLQVSDNEGDIIIEPVTREVVYVPYYDSRVVYGSWWWPDYPPVYWHFPHIHHGLHLSHNFFWGAGIYVGTGIYFSSFHWRKRHVMVVDYRRRHHYRFRNSRSLVRHVDARRWRHNPRHRRGVSYRTTRVRQEAFSERRHRRYISDRRERLRNSSSTISQRLRNSSTRQARDSRVNSPRQRNNDRAVRDNRQRNNDRAARDNRQRNNDRAARDNRQRNNDRAARDNRQRNNDRAVRDNRQRNNDRAARDNRQRNNDRAVRDNRQQRLSEQRSKERRASNRQYREGQRAQRNNSQRVSSRSSNYRNNRSSGRRSDYRRSNRSSGQRSQRARGDSRR